MSERRYLRTKKSKSLSGLNQTEATRIRQELELRPAAIRSDVANVLNAPHTHEISEVTGLQTALDDAGGNDHNHTIDQVTGLQDQLDGIGTSVSDLDARVTIVESGGGGSGGTYLSLLEQTTEPSDPAINGSVIWQSDGTSGGSDGDVLIKVNVDGVIKSGILFSFASVTAVDGITLPAPILEGTTVGILGLPTAVSPSDLLGSAPVLGTPSEFIGNDLFAAALDFDMPEAAALQDANDPVFALALEEMV